MTAAFFCVLAGLAFGSFLNVCITRLPQGESIVAPRSHCRGCGRPIKNRDNIPLLSWLVLRGKCRACGADISWRYPLVEAGSSLLFLMCWLKYGPGWLTPAYCVLCFLLLGLAVMDAETMLLPDRFTVPGIVLGVLLRGWVASAGGHVAAGLRGAGMAMVDGGIAAGLLLLVEAAYWLLRRRAGMGMGDVKLLAMLAVWLGLPRCAVAFVLAAVFGAAYGLYLVANNTAHHAAHRATATKIESKGSKRSMREGQLAIPFGAFLSVGGLYGLFLGDGTVRWYLQFFR